MENFCIAVGKNEHFDINYSLFLDQRIHCTRTVPHAVAHDVPQLVNVSISIVHGSYGNRYITWHDTVITNTEVINIEQNTVAIERVETARVPSELPRVTRVEILKIK